MFCGKCGYEVRDDDNFCPKCGHKLVSIGDVNVDTNVTTNVDSVKSIETKSSSIGVVRSVILILIVLCAGFLIYSSVENYKKDKYEKWQMRAPSSLNFENLTDEDRIWYRNEFLPKYYEEVHGKESFNYPYAILSELNRYRWEVETYGKPQEGNNYIPWNGR